MAIELTQRTQLILSQRLVLTPQLQMAIRLLQLSRVELIDKVQQELIENPALEERLNPLGDDTLKEGMESPQTKSDGVEGVASQDKIHDDTAWSNYLDEFNTPSRVRNERETREATNFESYTSQKQTLTDHLLWQLMMISESPEDETIGSHIIGNLNKDGYLDASIEDICRLSGFSSERVEQVLSRMQTFDPPGICARDLRECLLIQAVHYGLENTIVTDIIQNHLNHLENKKYREISKALKVKLDEVIHAVKIINNLEPKPTRDFTDDESPYITPDIYVYKFEDEFVITLNNDGMPLLHINPICKNLISRNGEVAASDKKYIADKMQSAKFLIRSIHERQRTIYRVMESILKLQRDFFEKGITHLKPMVLRDVAHDIDMHESTISRVTTNKFVHTPQGIFELKYFFNSSINRVGGGEVASESVKNKIQQIIKNENLRKPYSDDQISLLLKKENIDIARRTVAKYRESLKILPSSKRKQFLVN